MLVGHLTVAELANSWFVGNPEILESKQMRRFCAAGIHAGRRQRLSSNAHVVWNASGLTLNHQDADRGVRGEIPGSGQMTTLPETASPPETLVAASTRLLWMIRRFWPTMSGSQRFAFAVLAVPLLVIPFLRAQQPEAPSPAPAQSTADLWAAPALLRRSEGFVRGCIRGSRARRRQYGRTRRR